MNPAPKLVTSRAETPSESSKRLHSEAQEQAGHAVEGAMRALAEASRLLAEVTTLPTVAPGIRDLARFAAAEGLSRHQQMEAVKARLER